MKRANNAVLAIGLAAGMAASAWGGTLGSGGPAGGGRSRGEDSPRMGLAMNLNRADLRFGLGGGGAIDAFVGFSSISGDKPYFDDTTLAIGGYYVQSIKAADPVDFHFLAGLGYGSDNSGGITNSDIAIQGGVGVEYFLPGTKSLSIEGDVGLGIHILGAKASGGSVSGTKIALEDLTGGVIYVRYYFDN